MDSTSLTQALELYKKGEIEQVEGLLDQYGGEQPNASAEPDIPVASMPSISDNEDDDNGDDFGNDVPNPTLITEETKLVVEALMIEWLKCDDQLIQKRAEVRQLNKDKNEIGEKLMHFMSQWQIPEITRDDPSGDQQALSFKMKESKQGYTKKLFMETIQEVLSPTKAQELMNALESKRTVTEKASLARKGAKPKPT